MNIVNATCKPVEVNYCLNLDSKPIQRAKILDIQKLNKYINDTVPQKQLQKSRNRLLKQNVGSKAIEPLKIFFYRNATEKLLF